MMGDEFSATSKPRNLPTKKKNPFSGFTIIREPHRIDGIWSGDHFLAHMPRSKSSAPCRQVRDYPRKQELRVFWYPTVPADEPNAAPPPPPSVQVKIKAFLESVRYQFVDEYFIQFWAPSISSSGQSMLTVLEQPFGMGSLDYRFCRFRYVFMKKAIRGDENFAVGPVGRVFSRGSPEYAERMDSYSREEFPMRRYAKFSGSYLALPIFENGPVPQNKCSGVLEFFSMKFGSLFSSAILRHLKDLGFSCTRSHSKECPQADNKLLLSLYRDVLNLVKEEHKLPLIQIWMPCFCGDETSGVTQLFCCWSTRGSLKSSVNFVKDRSGLANGWYSVENGKGLVGRAYSQKKSCYLGDTKKLSTSEYPLAHFARLCNDLPACFAIPVQSLDPKIHDFVLEVFLPWERNRDHGNAGVVLESLLSSVAQNRAPQYYSGPIPSELEPNKDFCVRYSHSDGEDFVYFDVSHYGQTVSTGKAVGDGREERPFQPLQKKVNDQNLPIHVAPPNRYSFLEYFKNGYAEKVKAAQSALDHNVHKRKEFHNILSTMMQNTQSVEASGQVTQEPEVGTYPNKKARENEATVANFIPESAKGKSIAPGSDEIHEINRGSRIIVKANFRSDVAKFFFWSNSGIEQLHGELHKRFKLEGEKFKVKYKDDVGRWFVLSCHEDLLFHLETSKSPGQIILGVSVSPATC